MINIVYTEIDLLYFVSFPRPKRAIFILPFFQNLVRPNRKFRTNYRHLHFCLFPEFAKTEKGYSMASRLQHILSEALRYSIAKTQKDPSLLPRLMRFMMFDLEHFRRADIQESAMIYSKFGAVMNVCLPLTYDIYCQAD